MDTSKGNYNELRLKASILEQRFKSVQGFYSSIPHHYDQQQPSQLTLHHQQHGIKNNTTTNKNNINKYSIDNVNYINGSNHNHHSKSRKLDHRRQKLNKHNKTNDDEQNRIRTTGSNATITNGDSEQVAALKGEIKKRLSLPVDTSISDNFLTRHTSFLLLPNQQPLSRIFRRKSLLEIGFGRLSTYLKQHVLGSGTYSTVYKGTSRLSNKLVALKEIHLEKDEGIPFTAIREVSLLKQLKHNNIVTLHDIIYAQNTLTLVFEFVDRDLSSYMDECDHKMDQNNVKIFLYQMLRGLKFCHDRRILHRDLKPQNILISSGGELKLADFGLARSKSVPTKTFTDEVVTLWYRPPDVLLGNIEYGTSIDMWGVGCIFFEMSAGYTLFTGSSPKKQIEGIFEIIGTPDESSWPLIKYDLEFCSLKLNHYTGRDLRSMAPNLDDCGIDLLRNFLKCDPRFRISAQDAVRHRYFSSLPREIHDLPDDKSIFSISSIRFNEELSCNRVQNVQHYKR